MKTISTFVIALLVFGFFILALPEKGYSGLNPLGCCAPSDTACSGCGDLDCAISAVECGADSEFILNAVCIEGTDCMIFQKDVPGCCVLSTGNCLGVGDFEECNGVGVAWFQETDCSEVPQCAPIISPIPTISKWGLIAMAGILGIVGFMVIRRRKVTA